MRGRRWTSRVPHAVAVLPWMLVSVGVVVLIVLLVKVLVVVLTHDRYAEHGPGARSESIVVPGASAAAASVPPTRATPTPSRSRREADGRPGTLLSPPARTPSATSPVAVSPLVSPPANSPTPAPTVLLNDDAAGIDYRGRWSVSQHRPYGDHRDDVHWTTRDGDSFRFTFTGTGLDYITSRDHNYGDADVWVFDSNGRTVKRQRVSARAERYTPQQTVFSVADLPRARYTVWAVKRGGVYFQVDALLVRD
ncbi:hypothetical protein [Micromonospora sp. NPDC092111]|uniref:hypothetical protein n=1 Tax=Micromonospora sp. NPDC092111 TaxID=3364289 RepID=UPI0037F7E8DB